MNHGYMRCGDWNNPIHDEKCPLCGDDIYISKYQTNYACVSKECLLFNGAKQLIEKVNVILNMLNKKEEL